jgi:3'-5' exonuclease
MLPCLLTSVLFLDIETVPQYESYSALDETGRRLWDRKAEIILRTREEVAPEEVYNRAGIYAEFGKIVCISVGIIVMQDGQRKLCIKSFADHDERKLLVEFTSMLTRWNTDDNRFLCAHNGKEFDFPFIARRMIINDIPVPALLKVFGKKPWELRFLDTMELWKFGDYKNYTSLELLAYTFNIPTPKDDINGSMVHDVYWRLGQLERIKEYCQKDVITLVQVFLRMHSETLLPDHQIEVK